DRGLGLSSPMRELRLFIATSLDGYIAAPGDNLDFLKLVEQDGEDYGYAAFTADIDTILIGRKTYDFVVKAIGPGHYDTGTRDVYVATRTPRERQGRVIFHSGDLAELVRGLKGGSGKHIYCD